MFRFIKKIMLLGVFLAIVVSIDAWRVLHSPFDMDSSQDYEFTPGATAKSLSRDLKARGWMTRSYYLSGWLRLTGQASKLKAGEYIIEPGTTALGLIELMLQGRVKLYTLTLIEGHTFRDVLSRVHASPDIKHVLRGKTPEQIMAAIGHAGEHPEGLFFPDTYSFPRGLDDISLLQRAYDTLQQKLADAWDKRDPGLPFATPYEALIMASIVEKESANKGERKQIAGLFINRLRIGMRLQTDPTVIYGLGESFDGNLRRRDLESDTPYNSYTRKGLPPTPIAMPGLEAIEAVMHPDATPYLYFVAKGDGTGTHAFSTTLAEHEANVDKYQRKKKKK